MTYRQKETGHNWSCNRGDHSEPAQQILTVRFDDQSNIRSIDFNIKYKY